MSVQELVQTFVNGMMMASVYALVAMGLTLVVGLLNIVNFAHGYLMLLAAYLLFATVDSGIASYWVAFPFVVAIMAAIGSGLEFTLFRRVRDVPINGIFISVGVIGVLQNVFDVQWGQDPRFVAAPIRTLIDLGPAQIPGTRLMVIVCTGAVLCGLALSLRFTRIGRALRATAQDREAAALMGIPADRINNLAVAAGVGLAGVAGVLLAAVFPVEAPLGNGPLIKGFIVMVVGGAGSPMGAVLAAMILGTVEAFAVTNFSVAVAQLITFAILIAVLLVRPDGLVRTSWGRSL